MLVDEKGLLIVRHVEESVAFALFRQCAVKTLPLGAYAYADAHTLHSSVARVVRWYAVGVRHKSVEIAEHFAQPPGGGVEGFSQRFETF